MRDRPGGGVNGAPVDLNALARAHPPERFTLDLADAIAQLEVGEIADAAIAAQIPMDVIRAGKMPADLDMGYRFLRAIAWVMRRRADPGITWAEASTWNVIPEGGAPDPKPSSPAEQLTSS